MKKKKASVARQDIRIESKEIKLVPLDEIKLNPENRNTHRKEQIDQLAAIIKYQGFREPGVISNRSGILIAGEGRYLAAKKLKLEFMPCIYQDFESVEQEYAYGISTNAIASWSELNLSQINIDIGMLGPEFDINLLGIEGFEIEVADKLPPGSDEDEVPEVRESLVKLGDVWQLGNHRLMCGDASLYDSVQTLTIGSISQLIFTDPPYGVSYKSNMRTKSRKFDVLENDDVFLTEWVQNIPTACEGWVFIWTTWKVLNKWLEITGPIGDLTNMIIWDKGGGGIGDLERTFLTDYEIALVFHRGAKITGKRIGSVWSVGKDRAVEYKHPTQKPVELAEMAILNCTVVNDLVLDLFGGSGSTLIACEKTNRKCYMMELDPHYCTVIIRRWEKYSNQKAVLLE